MEAFLESMGMPKQQAASELPVARDAPVVRDTPATALPIETGPLSGPRAAGPIPLTPPAEESRAESTGQAMPPPLPVKAQAFETLVRATEAKGEADSSWQDGAPSAPAREPIPYSSEPANRFPVRPDPVSSHGGVEQAIGLKLAGWIGAIVVVIGAAMGVKFAYDQGWLGGLPDTVKLGFFYAIGIALIGAGEVIYRRVSPAAAVGVYAAGIAGLFVVSYAGNVYFKLFDQPVAFALMAGACAIGALISLRGGLVSIAVLSLLGANIAPLILRQRTVGEVPLLVYLLTLQVLALALAHIGKGARWWILRNLALVTLSLWMAGRLIPSATAFSLATVTFIALYALLFQIENALAARRQGNGAFSHPTFSFAVTAALTIALLRWSMPLSDGQRGAIVVGLSFLAFTIGAALTTWREQSLKPLGQSFLVQGGILLFAAVPVALAGPWIFVAWALMALGYVLLGTILKRDRTAAAGVVIWFVAVFVLLIRLVIEYRTGSLKAIVFTIGEVSVPTYLLIALATTAIGYAMTLLLDRREPAQDGQVGRRKELDVAAKAIAVTATALAAVSSVPAIPSLASTGLAIAIAWLCYTVASMARSSASVLRALAGGMITLALAHWVAVDLIAARVSQKDAGVGQLLLNPTLGVGLLGTGSLWAMARLLKAHVPAQFSSASRLISVAVVLGMLALCVGLSIETERAVVQAVNAGAVLRWPTLQFIGFALTSLWVILAASLPWVGRLLAVNREHVDELRRVSGFLVSLVAAKFLLIECLGSVVQDRGISVSPLLNVQTLVAALVLLVQVYCIRTTSDRIVRSVGRAVVFLIPLVVGSIELSRWVGPGRTLVAFSVYWGLYAILSIAVGFGVRSAVLRFAGLGLLGITLLKIVFVDLANAGTGWRILSFLGLGTILLATSVLYGKLSPRLLGKVEKV